MSSAVVVGVTQGFVVSTDTIAFKQPLSQPGARYGRVQGTTHKMFQISDDVLVAAVGDFTNYLAALNAAAKLKLPTEKLVPELLDLCVKKAANSRVFVVYRLGGKVLLDTVELGHIRREQPGAHSFPDPLLNDLFMRVYESPEALTVRKSGMLGTAAIVNGFNAMAATLSPELSPPFDTVLFLTDGLFVLSGNLNRLPVADFW